MIQGLQATVGFLAFVGTLRPVDMERSDASGGSDQGIREPAGHLDSALRGRLPCVVCDYDLKGLSIRGVCPECGTAVRATILYTVDPRADEFQPIVFPRLTSTALVVWSSAALVATLMAWWPRVADWVAITSISRPASGWASWVMIWAAAISGIASLGLWRPTPATPFWKSAASLVASGAYVPLVWVMYRLHMQVDPSLAMPYLTTQPLAVERIILSLMLGACILVIIFGLRPNGRDFVRRSMAMRTKRVDRQTLVAMAAVVVVALVGMLVRLGAQQLPTSAVRWEQKLDFFGQMLGALGWMLFSLGMLSAVRDTFRVRMVMLIPAPSLRDVLEGPEGG